MLPLILAAVGMAKGISDAQQAEKDKYAEAMRDAAMIKYSPWSGIDPNKAAGKSYASASPSSGALAGGAAGFQTAQNADNSGADSDYRKAVADFYKSQNPAKPNMAGPQAAASAGPNLSPYAGLSVQGQPNLLQGQAVTDMPYGSGFGDA